jgi:predicted O-methyltransferase YrrM
LHQTDRRSALQQPTLVSDDRVVFGATEINLLRSSAGSDNVADFATRDDALFMLKSRPYVDAYQELGARLAERDGAVRTIVEVGCYRGGSAAFLNELFGPDRLICIDVADTIPAPLAWYAEQHPGVIRPYFSVSQDDRARIAAIIGAEAAAPLDLVVDDASHWYAPSKATFETLFPRLRPGGLYILEDWDWAHSAPAQEAGHVWAGQDALTNLVLQLVIAHASVPQLVSQVGFGPGLMWVQRGWLPVEPASWSLDAHLRTRGRTLGTL